MIHKFLGYAVFPLLVVMALATITAGTKPDNKAGQQAGERIDWQAVAAGGASGASTSYGLSGTVGQSAAGSGVSTSYRMYHGYWQDFGGTSCCTLGGDANHAGKVAIGDAVFIITYVYRGGPAPVCPEEADVTGNGEIGVGDAVYIITYIFRGGPAPTCP